MMNTPCGEREIRMLAQSDVLGVLADALRGPDADGLSPGQVETLLQAAGWSACSDLTTRWAELAGALNDMDPQAWSAEHHRLFEGATVCPLNQTAYVRRDKGVVLGDLCGFYEAFALRPRHESGEKPDHLVHELEFLSLLLVMQAHAVGAGKEEQCEVVADAARRFATDHLAEWLGAATAQLRQTSPTPLYQALADALDATWAALARDHDWPPAAHGDSPEADPNPPSDECGPIGDPVSTLTVAGRPLAQPANRLKGN